MEPVEEILIPLCLPILTKDERREKSVLPLPRQRTLPDFS